MTHSPKHAAYETSPQVADHQSDRAARRGVALDPLEAGKMSASMDPVPAIDIFASAGGLTLGFKDAKVQNVCPVETVCAVEIERYRVETFARHTPRAEILNTDIQRVDFAAYRGKIELVYGGPPCQPFSSGGHQRAARDERDMIPAFIRAIGAMRPAAFFMENVPGLVTGERRPYFAKILAEYRALGFTVAWQVVNAADYGVPQKRRRLFVVGMRGREFVFPAPSHGPKRRHPHVAVRDVLPLHQIGEPNPSRVFYAKRPDTRPSPYDGHLFNGGGRAIDRDQPCHTILASAGGNKTHFFDDFGLVPEYHRHLLAGGEPREGSLPGARRLTVAESAVIQTFPKGMVFEGPRSAQYHQVGDAVPPKLAAAMARALVRQLRLGAESSNSEQSEPAQQVMAQ